MNINQIHFIYIDEIFARDAVMDLYLILMTARLAGLASWRASYLIAALTGGLYAALSYLPEWGFLTSAPVQCAAGIGLALLAFGREENLIRLTILFFAVSSGFAGFVLALRLCAARRPDIFHGVLYHDYFLCLAAAACVYIFSYIISAFGFRAAAGLRVSGGLARVRISILGRASECVALLDSGNTLRDGGQPVLIISPEILNLLFPPELLGIFTPERLKSPPDLAEPVMRVCPELRPRLIPYHAVGVSAGLLLTVSSDWIETGGARYLRPRVALSPTRLGGDYQALWGGGF